MFERNIDAYSIWDQEKLWKSTVVLIGVGGGGSVVAELLVRTGVGHLVLIDGDQFEESNLNRQLFATVNTLNMNKVDAAKERLLSINPHVKIETYPVFLSENNNLIALYPEAIVCDCADGAENKLIIADLCAKTNNKLVTGGDGIFNFFVAKFTNPSKKNTHIVFQDDIEEYKKDKESMPCFPSPATVWIQASLQAYEVINAILNLDQGADNKIQRYNLLTYTNTVTEE